MVHASLSDCVMVAGEFFFLNGQWLMRQVSRTTVWRSREYR